MSLYTPVQEFYNDLTLFLKIWTTCFESRGQNKPKISRAIWALGIKNEGPHFFVFKARFVFSNIFYTSGIAKRVTLVYLYYVNRCGHHKKLSIAKLDFVQVCGLSLNFYNNTLRKFYKFSDSWETWASPTLQSADWPISRQYYWPQVRQRVYYPEV